MLSASRHGSRVAGVQMPSSHVIPATPHIIDAARLKIMFTPATSASPHSLHCSPRIAAWLAGHGMSAWPGKAKIFQQIADFLRVHLRPWDFTDNPHGGVTAY